MTKLIFKQPESEGVKVRLQEIKCYWCLERKLGAESPIHPLPGICGSCAKQITDELMLCHCKKISRLVTEPAHHTSEVCFTLTPNDQ